MRSNSNIRGVSEIVNKLDENSLESLFYFHIFEHRHYVLGRDEFQTEGGNSIAAKYLKSTG